MTNRDMFDRKLKVVQFVVIVRGESPMPGMQPEECEHCGGELKQEQSWTRKSIPLIGSTMEYAEYTCTECGQGARFKRKEGSREWQKASV